MRKITLDLDGIQKNKLFAKLELINLLFKHVEFRKSSKKKNGYHIIFYAINIDHEEEYNIRFILGDDYKRLQNDVMRKKMGLSTNILFTKKKKMCVEKDATGIIRLKTVEVY